MSALAPAPPPERLDGASGTFAPFDYSKLDPEVATACLRAADAIKYREHMVGESITVIGRELIAVKGRLGYGQFRRWLAAEFEWDERTARRFMSVADAFDGKTDTVSDLPPTTLYALASPSTPSAVRDEIVGRRGNGEALGDFAIKSMISEAKRLEGRSSRRRATKKAREKWQSPDAVRKRERKRQKDLARQEQYAAARNELVCFIRDRVGDDLPELIALIDKVGPGGLWSLPDMLRATLSDEKDGAS